jgi:hypothetical protein
MLAPTLSLERDARSGHAGHAGIGADVLLLGLEVHCRCTCGPGGGHEEVLLCGATDIARVASLHLGS